MTRLGFGDPQTWGYRHYDASTKDDRFIEQMNDFVDDLMFKNGFGHFWGELCNQHPKLVDELLRKQLAYNREYQ